MKFKEKLVLVIAILAIFLNLFVALGVSGTTQTVSPWAFCLTVPLFIGFWFWLAKLTVEHQNRLTFEYESRLSILIKEYCDKLSLGVKKCYEQDSANQLDTLIGNSVEQIQTYGAKYSYDATDRILRELIANITAIDGIEGILRDFAKEELKIRNQLKN